MVNKEQDEDDVEKQLHLFDKCVFLRKLNNSHQTQR